MSKITLLEKKVKLPLKHASHKSLADLCFHVNSDAVSFHLRSFFLVNKVFVKFVCTQQNSQLFPTLQPTPAVTYHKGMATKASLIWQM